jgi:hypothetical protein
MNRDATEEQRGGANRTTADVRATLVELGRTLKGWRFYARGHGARRELLDRSWRALQASCAATDHLPRSARRRSRGGLDAIGVGRVDDLGANSKNAPSGLVWSTSTPTRSAHLDASPRHRSAAEDGT